MKKKSARRRYKFIFALSPGPLSLARSPSAGSLSSFHMVYYVQPSLCVHGDFDLVWTLSFSARFGRGKKHAHTNITTAQWQRHIHSSHMDEHTHTHTHSGQRSKKQKWVTKWKTGRYVVCLFVKTRFALFCCASFLEFSHTRALTHKHLRMHEHIQTQQTQGIRFFRCSFLLHFHGFTNFIHIFFHWAAASLLSSVSALHFFSV